jgi:hypothetical protein
MLALAVQQCLYGRSKTLNIGAIVGWAASSLSYTPSTRLSWQFLVHSLAELRDYA